MSRRTRQFAIGLLAGVVFAFVAGWLLWRYYGTRPITLSDGRVAADLSLAEAPRFGGDAFEASRRDYLEKLEKYRSFALQPVSGRDADAMTNLLRPLIVRAVEADPKSRAAVRSLPGGALDALAEQAGVALARLAGLPLEDFMSRLPSDAEPAPPRASGTLAVLLETYAPGGVTVPPADDAPATEWQHLFASAYALNRDFEGGEALVRAIGTDPTIFHCAVNGPRPSDPHADQIVSALVQDRLGVEQYKLLLSGASQAQVVINRSPESWAQVLARQDDLVHAEVVFIVENGAGDRYPVSLLYYYDTTRDVWWLRGVTRKVSLRAMSTPAFVF